MDRLLKPSQYQVNKWLYVRVTVWWIDYWNNYPARLVLKTQYCVRVTVWWIDYWNIKLSFTLVYKMFEWPFDGSTTETIQNHFHKNQINVRVTVWWIDYWNNKGKKKRKRNSLEWPFDGSTTETLKVTCLVFLKYSSSDRLMDRLLKHNVSTTRYRVESSSDRLMDRLLKLFSYLNFKLLISSSDRLMDRLLKQSRLG